MGRHREEVFRWQYEVEDNVIGELVGFVLWEEGLFSDEIAGEKIKVFVSEGNVDALDLLVLGCHDGCLMLGKEVWICS